MKIHKQIDQLLMDGKEEEAIPLIEEVWRKRKTKEQKKIDNIKRLIEQQLAVLEKRNI
jgi:hypothetical protein